MHGHLNGLNFHFNNKYLPHILLRLYGSWIYNYLCNQCVSQLKGVSSNPTHCEVYSIQHYVTKFVSDLRQVCGFSLVLRFLPPIKLTAMI